MLQAIVLVFLFLLILTLIIVWFATKNTRIKIFMRKAFFPFMTEKYRFLEKKRGYRLLKVLFLLWLLFSLWFFFSHFTNSQNNHRETCMEYISSLEANERTAAYNSCRNIRPTTALLNLVYALLITLSFNYIAQFLYFKLIIYIIYGDLKK